MEKPTPDLHDGMPPLLNIDNLAGGAIYELLAVELKKAAENISDPNTSDSAKRTVTVKVEMTPYKDRSGASLSMSVASKLPGTKPAEGTAYIIRRNGEFLMVGKNHRQLEMELGAAEPPPKTAARPS